MKKLSLAAFVLIFLNVTFADAKNTHMLSDFVKEHQEKLAFYVQRSKQNANPRKAGKKNKQKAPDLSSEELAFATVKESAENGYVPAQDLLAYCYATGAGTKIDKVLAFCWYMQAAFNGSKSARESLVACFEQGIGVAKNVEIARNLRAALNDA